jgi:hypothetical protein
MGNTNPSLLASSAFCLKAYGKLGKAPRPFQANACSLQSVALQIFRDQAYEPPQEPVFLRILRSDAGHLGSKGRSGDFDYLAVAFLLFWRGKFLPYAACADETFALKERLMTFCIRRSKAICCIAQGRWQKPCHTSDNYALSLGLMARSFFYACLCTLVNSIFYDCDYRPFQGHTLRNEVAT